MHRLVPSTRSSVYSFALLVVIVGAYVLVQPEHSTLEVGVVVLVAAVALVEVAMVVWKPTRKRQRKGRTTVRAARQNGRRRRG